MLNKVILIGRVTRDPDVKYSQGATPTAIAKFGLAVNRKGKSDETDFINCIGFGKNGEFAEKYLKKGMQMAIVGRLQTGSYTNKDGNKVYTTDVVVEEYNFTESKKESVITPVSERASDTRFVPIDESDDDIPF